MRGAITVKQLQERMDEIQVTKRAAQMKLDAIIAQEELLMELLEEFGAGDGIESDEE